MCVNRSETLLMAVEQVKVPGYLSFAEAALKDKEDFMAPPEDAE